MLADPHARLYEHIVIGDGIARIVGTRYQVIQLVTEKLAYGWSPEEMQYQHPDLTLGQIYAALAYYADHEAEINNVIERDLAEYEQLRVSNLNSPLRQKLRVRGLIA